MCKRKYIANAIVVSYSCKKTHSFSGKREWEVVFPRVAVGGTNGRLSLAEDKDGFTNYLV